MNLFQPAPIVLNDPCFLPLCTAGIRAGFPSPAEDCREDGLDLTQRFVRHPTSTFVVQAIGESLTGSGIYSGDYLVVDRSRTPRDGDIVVAVVDGAFTAKRYDLHRGRITLRPTNPAYPAIPWHEGCAIWGVVTSVHRDLLVPARCA